MFSTRRQMLLSAGAAAAAAALPEWAGAAVEPMELSWRDLIPASERANATTLSGIIQHGGAPDAAPLDRPIEEILRQDLDGVLVKLPGYALPLEIADTGVTEFLLVPYIGACIHVPPPPPNQMVLINLDEPRVFKSLFEAVWVTGQMDASVRKVAGWLDVGYRLAGTAVEPYVFKD